MSTIIDVIAAETPALPVPAGAGSIDSGLEIRRITRAHKLKREEALLAHARKRREMRALAALFLAVAIPAISLFAFPATAVRAIPGLASVYGKLGMEVNARGLAFRDVRPQLVETDGTRVFAVRGQVENISPGELRIPAIRFALLDGGKEIFSWILPATTRALKPGESTSFLTRIASPPETADDVEIRFARADEMGSNAGP